MSNQEPLEHPLADSIIDNAPPAPQAKTAALVAAELRRQIAAGDLQPGDTLLPESILREEFGISRPTMREALRLLEAQSMIEIRRGKHGGARVVASGIDAVSGQVGVLLQMQGATLSDLWRARAVIEPPAAAMLAARRDPAAIAALEANLAQARDAAHDDPLRYADLSASFSLLIARYCGNLTLHMVVSLLFDLVRRQHGDVTRRTLDRISVAGLRRESVQTRERALTLMRTGRSAAVERLWRAHLDRMGSLVLAAYGGDAPLDVLGGEEVRTPRASGHGLRRAAPGA